MKLDNFIEGYLSIISNELKGLNLTRITNKEEFRVKQIEDSLLPFVEFNECFEIIKKSDVIYDLGFGGGFPLLPLCLEFPDKRFIGIETRLKKVNAVRDIAKKLGIDNVSFEHERYENIKFPKKSLIVSKAMASADKVLSNIKISSGSYVSFYKGPAFYTEELVKVTKIAKKWEIFFKKDYNLSDESERTFVVFNKCST